MRRHALVCLFLQLTFELCSCTNIQLPYGSTVKLPCFSSESYFSGENIIWKFNGQNLTQSLSSARAVDNGLHISISPVTAASEGEYVCLTQVNDIELTRGFNLSVLSLHSTITVTSGTNVHLPCHIPSSSVVSSNALWFKDTGDSKRTQLNLEDDPTDEKKVDLLYPMDHDQSIIIRQAFTDDSGVYSCESAEGERLHTINLIVEDSAPPLLSCKDLNDVLDLCKEEESRTAEPILRESMTEFSMRLYSHFKDEHPRNNLLFSPVSINGILSHLLLGANGETRKALERAMCLPHDFHCVHSQMRKQRERMSFSLQMASQIFYNSQMNLSDAFTNLSIQYYEAEPVKLLKTSEENTKLINDWVANKTKNKIPKLLEQVSPSTQLMLLNAVSFSGEWKFQFNDKPKKRDFIKLNGDRVKVPLLYHSKYLATMMYVVEMKAQVAKFSLTGDNSLYILLPHSNTEADLQQVEKRMTDGNVRQMMEHLRAAAPQNIEVTLPQIKLDVEPNMITLIKKLGLSSLFEGASLSCLQPGGDLVLDDIKHKAFLALTKHGVEAGAVTTLSFSRSLPSFSALRPFIMMLWNDEANVPLFVGRVMEP
ncbi:plasma protease C1 inhibitor [Nothobranchius furzeri]|uniref:Plasma protease C1 inhibitor-like n=1 Tax=Nothobranchius furzeri TaxID=105023 RepID=A0A9D2YC45_NOTFU|nr:plasma protease C1 inhibitor [Nothobranchius furzeri]KAF7217860.1 plasma protease C1 inhibitor-like [Nothobranchius furzeri]